MNGNGNKEIRKLIEIQGAVIWGSFFVERFGEKRRKLAEDLTGFKVFSYTRFVKEATDWEIRGLIMTLVI